MRNGRWLAAVACILSVSGCGGGGGDDGTPAPVLQSIAITPTFTAAAVGQTRQFTATGTYSDGSTQNVTATASWSSSVAEVASINAQGIATGVAVGATTIAATLGSVSAQTGLNVTLPTGWTFEIHNPQDGALAAPTLFVAARIEGPGEIDSVTAQAGSNSANLTFFTTHPQCLDSGGLPRLPCWAGELTLPATFGVQHRVVIHAEDALGNSAAVVRAVTVDQQPIVEVDAPGAAAIARPQLQLDATCSDDAPSGCVSLTAAICGSVGDCSDPVAEGTGAISATVDLQAHNGRSRLLRYRATDTGGQQAFVFIPIFVEDSQHLQAVDEVPGAILDADATRVLELRDETITLVDRASGNGTEIQTGVAAEPAQAFLTTAGAAFVLHLENPTRSIATSWENGGSVDLGNATELSAAGSYVLWNDGSELWRRNVDTATDELVSDDTLDNGNAVIADGTVAFAERMNSMYNVGVLAPGDTTPTFLTADTAASNVFPRTDGASFMYRKQAGNEYRLILYRNGSEEDLLADPTDREFLPDSGYQIAGGWLAYLQAGPTGVLQVWRADPGEQHDQLSGFGADSRIERLAADGTVLFVSGGRRYLVVPDETDPVDVGSDLGKSLFVDGVPHVAIGGTLFRVQ
jgi:hypothetical protein